MKRAFLIGLLLSSNYLMAQQLPSVSTPRPHTMQPGISKNYPSNPTIPGVSFQNNRQSVPQQTYHPGEVNARNQAVMRSIEEDIAYFKKMERDRITLSHLIYKGFPSWKDSPGTEYFFNAYGELDAMLRDSMPLNLERAIFLVENAFLGNSMEYSDFQETINQKVKYCQWRMSDLKLDPNDGLAKNMVIYSLLTDTLQIKEPGTEKMITHYPLKYNLDDYDSHQEYTSHFISTLLKTNVGQCYSMPLVYLIMAERLGAEAYLALAPSHSLVKIKDDKGAWFNLELTTRAILSDYHYMNSSYIKSEAIRNKLYLNALTPKQTVALLFTTLGRYYQDKYGYDPFIWDCADQTLKYLPNSVDARIMESNYQTRLTLEIARLIGAHNPEELKKASPDAYKHYQHMIRLYKELDDSGYEEMPKEIYERWLRYVSRLKADELKESQPALRKVTH